LTGIGVISCAALGDRMLQNSLKIHFDCFLKATQPATEMGTKCVNRAAWGLERQPANLITR